MSTAREFRMPDLGEGLTSADLLTWAVSVGDTVELNQVLAEVETAKAVVELPSPYAGVVTALLVEPGTTVAVGAPIIRVDSVDGATPPSVLVGSGPRTDQRSRRRTPVSPSHAEPTGNSTLAAPTARRAVRASMASAMVASSQAPQASVLLTVNVASSMELLAKLRASTAFANLTLSPLTLAAKALVTAIALHPEANAHWDDARRSVVVDRHVNLGIAVASDQGLSVPNIKNAHTLSLLELARALTDLTATARAGRTDVEHLTGGTVTITNVGVFGVDGGIALLNPGEAVILCLGAVAERPWVVDGRIDIRSVATLTLTFDHRVLDGRQAANLLQDVAAMLADSTVLLAHL